MTWFQSFFVGLGIGALVMAPSAVMGQGFGGTGMAAPAPAKAPPVAAQVIAKPETMIALQWMNALDGEVELGEINTPPGKLDQVLREKVSGLPVFLDRRALELAGLGGDASIKAEIPAMPLRSALRELLEPLSLRAVVQAEGLVLTADFASLARRGIATDRWVDLSDAFAQRLKKNLDAAYSATSIEVPLENVIRSIAREIDVPIMIDRRALEEIGLSADQPITLELEDVPLRSFLNLMLGELGLTYIAKDHVLSITTIESAERNLHNRIYWLEGTGVPVGDFQGIMDTIQTSIAPDTWEALGGPSTIAVTTVGNGNRPGLVISTTYTIHHEIESLLKTMRDAHYGPDPVLVQPAGPAAPARNSQPAPSAGGGMF
ncbi:MAG: hypothetical protein MI861_05060 [Pirellulales bacterium]|nr:hypothetical protein [Pirellulales bacterium]